ncbi:MAG: VCBS repeat-containing protein, partial [Candidatus Electrothrix sp. AR4]|nr:VCBS repeat-containing protein [Candidatus Electrothrix sp. AR4]
TDEDAAFGILTTMRSRKIAAAVQAMDVGDLDGDGKVEILVLERGNLALYHVSANHFQRIAEQPIARHLGLHTVYLADLDENGIQEIYIGASSGAQPASQIIEWDGANFHFLYQNAPYYLRPGINSAGKPILIGQAGGSFYRLTRNNAGMLDKVENISVPTGYNIYDFIRVDLDRDGILEFVGITRSNKLVVMNQTGEILWKSETVYGASEKALGTLASRADGDRNPVNNPEPIYLHTRIIAQDQNGDGKPEIILGRNRLSDIMFFKRIRYVEGSSVCVLSWNGARMETLFETPKKSGYTVDYQMLKNAGQSDGGNLFFVERVSRDTSLSFWKSEEFVIYSYGIGGRQHR